MSKINKAFQLLKKLVSEDMEFPDAEDRVLWKFNLTLAQIKEVRQLYDTDEEINQYDN